MEGPLPGVRRPGARAPGRFRADAVQRLPRRVADPRARARDDRLAASPAAQPGDVQAEAEKIPRAV